VKGCLEGVRVLELGNFISGPYGTMLLADMGAEVIKVENPKGGDPFRGWDLGGDQPNFWAYNRGKKSITLNLQTAEGKEIFLALAKKADVVLDNYRPGVMKKLGIDYDTVSKMNPRIIYLSITGTGSTGPYAKRPAYDTVGQGLGGMLSLLMDAKTPRPIGPNYADSLSGMFACIGVLGALGRPGGNRQRAASRHDDGRFHPRLLDCSGDRRARDREGSGSVYATDAVADLRVQRLRRIAICDPSVVAAEILGRIVQRRRPPGTNRRPALQQPAKPPEELFRAEQSFRRILQRTTTCALDGTTGSQRRAAYAGLQLTGSVSGPANQTHGVGNIDRA
jgi:hypothetical protein